MKDLLRILCSLLLVSEWNVTSCFGQSIGYDAESGILKRVTENLDNVMKVPIDAINLMETFHNLNGFRPHGLHATGRDRVLTYLYSLIRSFEGLQLYFGTELGEYFAYFDTEVAYREPGNSGYSPDDPEMSKYWPICVDGGDGAIQNCQMAEGANYIECVNDCELVKCVDKDSQRDCSVLQNNTQRAECEAKIKWCPDYTIQQVQANSTVGYVPLGYHCYDHMGMFSQDHDTTLGKCSYWDNTPVDPTRVFPGPFAYCGGQESCNGTCTGLLRSLDYDPRQRPWYIDAKEKQQEHWSSPYPFHTHSNIITKIGITYAHPYYTKNEDDDKTVFQGVFAVDYTLYDISVFLLEHYGETDDIVVVVFEAAGPNYLIGVSTGTNPYREVLASDESISCTEEDEDCVTIRIPATEIASGNYLDKIASRAVQAQRAVGFPLNDVVRVKETDDLFSASFLSRSMKYVQPDTDLEWIVLVATPHTRATSDTIEPGDILFVTLILVASIGCLGCGALFVLWYSKRKERAVMYGDFTFTCAFLVDCILLNLTSFTLLGENTDAMCMTRFWTFNLTFALTIATLLVKVYRVYTLVGGGSNMRRKVITNNKAAIMTAPIIATELLMLLIFTFIDPPQAVEEMDLDASRRVQSITCQHDTRAFMITQMVYDAFLVVVGCVLSFLSRNLDSQFGEAKQLFLGMYNVAFTGVTLVILLSVFDASPAAVYSFQSVGIFWATQLTCGVFVVPRLVQTRDKNRGSLSVLVSGLEGASSSFMLPGSARFDEKANNSFYSSRRTFKRCSSCHAGEIAANRPEKIKEVPQSSEAEEKHPVNNAGQPVSND